MKSRNDQNQLDQSNSLFYYRVRIPKEESYFLYFTLEAYEGMSFYSTTDDSLGQPYRDIEIKGSIDFKEDIDHLLKILTKKLPLEILSFKQF